MASERKRTDTSVQVGRGSIYVVRSTEPAPPFGQNTIRFFAEGERHEANDWQDTVLPPDDEPEPKNVSGSFDKVPRQKGAMVALALFGVFFVAGVAFGVWALVRGGRAVEASTVDFVRGIGSTFLGGASQPAAVPASTPPAGLAPTATPDGGTNAASLEGGADTGTPEGGAGAGTAGDDDPAAAAVPTPPSTGAVPEPRADESHGPSGTAAAEARRRPRSVAKPARRQASESAFDSAKSGTPAAERERMRNPVASGALVPPRLAEPSIAPANTGAATVEKTVPSPEELRAPTEDEATDPGRPASRQATEPPPEGNPDPFEPSEEK